MLAVGTVCSFLDNIIMKAMEGKMKLAPGNSLNPAAMGEALKEMGGEMAEGVALKAAIKAAQPLLSPILEKIGLAYSDVEMVLNREITELEDAKEAASDPQARHCTVHVASPSVPCRLGHVGVLVLTPCTCPLQLVLPSTGVPRENLGHGQE